MNNQPLVFDRIIHGNLRPWLDTNKHDEKFTQIIRDLKPIEQGFQPLYEIDFYRCFNCKTKYYHKLIINEADNYCNRVIELIRSDDDLRIVKYLLGNTLKKKLKTFLKDVGKLIKANDYDLKYINPYKSGFDVDTDHKADTYIIQLLKTAPIKVYLEIQEVFKSYITDEEYMEVEDLYLQVLSEPIPEQTFLKRQTIIEIVPVEVRSVVHKIDEGSISNVKSFKYNKLATNPDALNDLWDSLKLNLLIDVKTTVNDFKKVFSGKEITNPIRWTGNQSEFYWFIHLIYIKYKLVEDRKQQQWKIAGQCFIQTDGTPFDVSKLRKMKSPNLTSRLIEKAVMLLK